MWKQSGNRWNSSAILSTNESKKPRKAWNLHSQEKLDLCMSFAFQKRGSLYYQVQICIFYWSDLARFIFLKLPGLKKRWFATHLQITYIQNVWFSGMKYTIRIFNTYRIVYIMYHIYPLYTKLNVYFTLDVKWIMIYRFN